MPSSKVALFLRILREPMRAGFVTAFFTISILLSERDLHEAFRIKLTHVNIEIRILILDPYRFLCSILSEVLIACAVKLLKYFFVFLIINLSYLVVK